MTAEDQQTDRPNIATFFGRIIPNLGDQHFIFDLLMTAIDHCQRLNCEAWCITRLKHGFRLNVGPVEVMTAWAVQRAVSHSINDAIEVRLLLSGEDCLSKVGGNSGDRAIDLAGYKSVRVPHWIYRGVFESTRNGIAGQGRREVERDAEKLLENFLEFVSHASHTPNGKVRTGSLFQRFHDQSIYDHACFLLNKAGARVYEVGQHLQDNAPVPVSSTEAERLVIERVGQDLFRSALLQFWGGRCCVTGLGLPALLRASHCQPWASCSEDSSRLDVFNGLLLAPNIDALYDAGFISFNDDGTIMISEKLDSASRNLLGVSTQLKIVGLLPAHAPYLAHHRERVYVG